jgi:L-cystine transport system permease protein
MLDIEFIKNTLITTAGGLPETMELVLVTLVISIPLAFYIAVVNQNPKRWLSKIFKVYISFVRSIPVIIIIFLIYHSLPLLLTTILNRLNVNFNVYEINNMVYGCIVFSFVSIPSLSEVFRAGLNSVSANQMEAAKSVGMTPFQAYIHIIIPQAIEAALPVMCTFVTNLIKMTSLAFCMSIKEITGEAKVAAAASIRYIECYVVIFVMYLIINIIVEQIFKYFERNRKSNLVES